MDNIKVAIVNGQSRYSIELAPGVTAEANSLAEILRVILEYGVNHE